MEGSLRGSAEEMVPFPSRRPAPLRGGPAVPARGFGPPSHPAVKIPFLLPLPFGVQLASVRASAEGAARALWLA